MDFFEIISSILSTLLFLGVPLAVIIGLIVCIFNYGSANDEEKKSKYKKAAVVFGIILGVMALAVIALIIFLSTAIAFM